LNLPRGKLLDTLKGGPFVLRNLLTELRTKNFNGYIKIDSSRDDIEAHGVIILIASKPVMALYIWKERIFGQPSLPLIVKESVNPVCSLKVFSLPEEGLSEMNAAVAKFSSAKIDLSAFDIESESQSVAGPAATPPEKADEGMVEPHESTVEMALELFRSPIKTTPEQKVDDDAAELYLSMSEMGVDTSDLKRKEDELRMKEQELRKELEEKLVERDRLKLEEESFLKMDEVFSKLLREREDELAVKEGELRKKEDELKGEINKKAEDIANREEELRRDIDRLVKEKEDMKRREEKLLEMEKMFRRVLTNTEERLKKKEEELLRKEEELERIVHQRMREIEELKAQVMAAVQKGGIPTEGIQRMEEALRQKEAEVRRKETDLETRLSKFQSELADFEKKKAVAFMPAPASEPKYKEDELVRLFKAIDSLFDKLPPDEINKFANSDTFNLYEELMVKLGLVKK
jgi:hypothetical protein